MWQVWLGIGLIIIGLGLATVGSIITGIAKGLGNGFKAMIKSIFK